MRWGVASPGRVGGRAGARGPPKLRDDKHMGATMGAGLTGIHSMLGGIVVVAMIVVAILAAIQYTGGNASMVRTGSMVAAGLLLLQYVLGLLLIGNGRSNSVGHYIIALLVVVPIALQHSSAKRLSGKSQAMAIMIWALLAAFLAVIAYVSGMYRF